MRGAPPSFPVWWLVQCGGELDRVFARLATDAHRASRFAGRHFSEVVCTLDEHQELGPQEYIPDPSDTVIDNAQPDQPWPRVTVELPDYVQSVLDAHNERTELVKRVYILTEERDRLLTEVERLRAMLDSTVPATVPPCADTADTVWEGDD